MKTKEGGWIILVLIILFLATSLSSAQELTGEEILEKIKGKITIIKNGTADIDVYRENAKGERILYLQIKIYRKISENKEKQLIEILRPADWRGMKILSIVAKSEGKIWSYLPDATREPVGIKISTEYKKPFMKTDFTYEEIAGSKDYGKEYDVQKLEDGVFENYPCYRLKLTPKEEGSEYALIKMWVWKEEFFPLKIEFYKEEGKLKKVLTNLDLKKENSHYILRTIIMSNKIKGTKTTINILKIDREEPNDRFFDEKRFFK